MRNKLLVAMMVVYMSLSAVACGDTKTESVESTVESTAGEAAEVTESEQVAETAKSEETPTEKAETKDEEKESAVKESSDTEDVGTQDLTINSEYANLPESEGFVFESNGDGTCTLSELGDCSDEIIVIPEKSPDGDVVTKIADYAFYGAEDISTIVFAGRKMELEETSFQSCEAEKIVITGCDLTIGQSAFSYCEDISEIYMDNSILDVGTYAFYSAGKDMSITINNCTGVLDENAVQSSAIVSLAITDSTIELGNSAFSYCEDLIEVLFENSTLEIGEYTFYDTGDDEIVTMTNCDMNIDDTAFQSSGIVTLNIDGGSVAIGESVFSYCEDMTTVIITADNVEIGAYAFYDCASLVDVSIISKGEMDDAKLTIDENAFHSSAVQNVAIECGQIELGDSVFSYCEDLVVVEIKGALTKIGDYVFYNCAEELSIHYNGKSYNHDTIENAE